MAGNDKDVRIGLNTEADTSGAEKAIEAIEEVAEAQKHLGETNPMTDGSQLRATNEVTEAIREETDAVEDLAAANEAALQKQREADVERAQAMKKAREEAEAAAPALDKVIGLQRAQLAQQFGEAMGRAAAAVRGLAVELQGANVKGAGLVGGLATGMETVSSAVQGAAAGFAVAGPLGAAIGGAVGLMSGPLKTAISGTVNDLKALKAAEDDAATSARNLKVAMDSATMENRRNSLFEFFDRGKQAITAAIAEYERFVKVRDATAAADTAVRGATQASSLRSGASPFQVGVAGSEGEFTDRIAALEREIQDAKARADLASTAAAAAENRAKLAEANDNTTQADVDSAKTEANTARVAAEAAQKNAETTIQVAQQELRALLAERDAKLEQAFLDIGDESAARASQILDLVNTASQQGETLTTAQKEAMARLQQALSDGNIAAAEQVQIQTDLRTVMTSLTNGTQESKEATSLFIKVVEGYETNLRTYNQAAQNMMRRLEQVESLAKELLEQSKNSPQPR